MILRPLICISSAGEHVMPQQQHQQSMQDTKSGSSGLCVDLSTANNATASLTGSAVKKLRNFCP